VLLFSVFLITNTFMPVSRTILRQFQCTCDGLGEINARFADPDLCYSEVDNSRRCFPDDASVTQIVALVCGTLYLFGIPIFYYKLIHETVSLVLSTSRQYKLLSIEIDRLESLSKQERALFAGEIKEYKRIQFKLVRDLASRRDCAELELEDACTCVKSATERLIIS